MRALLKHVKITLEPLWTKYGNDDCIIKHLYHWLFLHHELLKTLLHFIANWTIRCAPLKTKDCSLESLVKICLTFKFEQIPRCALSIKLLQLFDNMINRRATTV